MPPLSPVTDSTLHAAVDSSSFTTPPTSAPYLLTATRATLSFAGLEAFLVAFWMFSLVRPTLSNGDAAVYLLQSLDLDLSQRTIHLGYIASSTLFYWLLRGLELSPALLMNVFAVCWSLVGYGFLRALQRQLVPGLAWGVAPLFFLLGDGALRHSTTAEVYPMQLALELMALWAFGNGRSRFAGLAFGSALLVSPTTLMTLPMFFLFPMGRKAWTVLLSYSVLVWGAVISSHFEDYLWGPRGLFNVSEGVSLGVMCIRRWSELKSILGVGGGLTVVGGLAAWTGSWTAGTRLIGVLLGVTALTFLGVDRFTDVPTYGLSLALLSLVQARGFVALRDTILGSRPRAWGLMGLGCFNGLIFFQGLSVDQEARASRRGEREQALTLGALGPLVTSGTTIGGAFRERALLRYYAPEVASQVRIQAFEVPMRSGSSPMILLSRPSVDWLRPGGRLVVLGGGLFHWEFQPGRRVE